jgi:hypothetical protein
VLNLAAPGNIGHQALYAPVPGAPGLIKITLTSLSQMATHTLTRPLSLCALLSLLGVTMLAGAGLLFDLRPAALSKRSLQAALIGLPFITLVEILACLVPAAYGQSTPPPDRTLIVPYYLLVCALAMWGYLAGQYLRQWQMTFFNTNVIARRLRDEAISSSGAEIAHLHCTERSAVQMSQKPLAMTDRFGLRGQHDETSYKHENLNLKRNILTGGLVLLFAITSLFSAAQIMQLRPTISQFAAAWDRSHSLILDAQAKGLAQVTVPPFPNWAGIEDISPDANFWVNRCAKMYYGIEVQTQ